MVGLSGNPLCERPVNRPEGPRPARGLQRVGMLQAQALRQRLGAAAEPEAPHHDGEFGSSFRSLPSLSTQRSLGDGPRENPSHVDPFWGEMCMMFGTFPSFRTLKDSRTSLSVKGVSGFPCLIQIAHVWRPQWSFMPRILKEGALISWGRVLTICMRKK